MKGSRNGIKAAGQPFDYFRMYEKIDIKHVV